jgi:hypothetical protein
VTTTYEAVHNVLLYTLCYFLLSRPKFLIITLLLGSTGNAMIVVITYNFAIVGRLALWWESCVPEWHKDTLSGSMRTAEFVHPPVLPALSLIGHDGTVMRIPSCPEGSVISKQVVGPEVLTAAGMSMAIIWDTVSWSPYMKPHFGGIYHFHLQNSA